MAEKVFLVHGWSTDSTDTYQALHLKLAENGFQPEDIQLGRYVSLDNDVEISDIAHAMDRAMVDRLGPAPWNERFHFITHSTGALVVKEWAVRHYFDDPAKGSALANIVFLAGPHFGSRLAHHGRSMLAHAAYLGDTGTQVLKSLELGSEFSWTNNAAWQNIRSWKDRGIRPFCLTGDRVENDFFKSRIFPAGYEKGSDMVVRVPAGNLNHRRYTLDGRKPKPQLELAGEIKDVPFAAMADYVHSGEKAGIMNSIKKNSTLANHQSLKLIVQCLKVGSDTAYRQTAADLTAVTADTHKKRQAFAQLDFRFRDDSGRHVDDYSVILGAIKDGKEKASKTVDQTHKNEVDGSHFTVFINLKEFEPDLTYFLLLDAKSDTDLFGYQPDPFRVNVTGTRLTNVISADQTTQIDVILRRTSNPNLFVFHLGNDPELHVQWNRRGEIVKRNINPK